MIKGIFWVIDDKLLCFKNDTYNHRRIWANLPRETTGGFAYDHYRRGRVDVQHDKAIRNIVLVPETAVLSFKCVKNVIMVNQMCNDRFTAK